MFEWTTDLLDWAECVTERENKSGQECQSGSEWVLQMAVWYTDFNLKFNLSSLQQIHIFF